MILSLLLSLSLALVTAGPIGKDTKVVEGDIVQPEASNALLRNALNEPATLWPNGMIPYQIDGIFNDKERQQIAEAMAEISARTCIRFRQAGPSDQKYVFIRRLQGCYSQIGVGYKQPQDLSLDVGCMTKPTIIHELVHAIGFYHEHNRFDRDKYLSIKMDHVDPDQLHNFDRRSAHQALTFGPYDMESVMHYDEYAFTKDKDGGAWTMKSKLPWVRVKYESEKADSISPADVYNINELYQC